MMKERIFRPGLRLAVALWAAFIPALMAQTELAKKQFPEARWEKDICAFEARDRTNPPPKQAVLFIGSSSIRMWKNLAEAFPGQKVINRGFGGSQLSDSVAFVDRIVLPYEPKVVVLYAGDNDLADGKAPEQILAGFEDFVRRIQGSFPETRIGYISIKPSPARANYAEAMKVTNRLIRDYTQTKEGLFFVDVFTLMLGDDGKPKAELFLKDGLHPNAQAYEAWAEKIRPLLKKYSPAPHGSGS